MSFWSKTQFSLRKTHAFDQKHWFYCIKIEFLSKNSIFLKENTCFWPKTLVLLHKTNTFWSITYFSLRKHMFQIRLSASLGIHFPRPRKRSLAFPRPEIVFGATFYKWFYKAFGTRPFSRILASPGQVSPDVSRLIIFLRKSTFGFSDLCVRFLKDLQSNMLQTRSNLKWRLSQRICKARCFKPAPASNEAFL